MCIYHLYPVGHSQRSLQAFLVSESRLSVANRQVGVVWQQLIFTITGNLAMTVKCLCATCATQGITRSALTPQ